MGPLWTVLCRHVDSWRVLCDFPGSHWGAPSPLIGGSCGRRSDWGIIHRLHYRAQALLIKSLQSSWISFSSQWFLHVSFILFLSCTGIIYINFLESFTSSKRAGEPQQELMPGILQAVRDSSMTRRVGGLWDILGSAFPVRALEPP